MLFVTCEKEKPEPPDLSKNKSTFGSHKGGKNFTSNLDNLKPGKQYYARAFFVIDDVTVYSEEKVFTTKFVPVTDIDGNIYTTTTSISGSLSGALGIDFGLACV